MCRRAIVKPLNGARASRSARTKHDRRDRKKFPASLDFPWTFNSTYRLIGLIWWQLTGQAYCDAFSAARTDASTAIIKSCDSPTSP